LEAEPAPVAGPAPEPVVEEPKTDPEPAPVVGEPKSEPQVEPEPAPAPEPQDNHLEELINSLKEEIAALKESNGELQEKIKDMGKTPSVSPVNVNAKPSAGDTYSAWREQMRHML